MVASVPSQFTRLVVAVYSHLTRKSERERFFTVIDEKLDVDRFSALAKIICRRRQTGKGGGDPEVDGWLASDSLGRRLVALVKDLLAAKNFQR